MLVQFPFQLLCQGELQLSVSDFYKKKNSNSIQIGIDNKEEHTKSHTNCSIPIFKLGGFVSRDVKRPQMMRWLLWEEINRKVTGKKEVCKSKNKKKKECSTTICFFHPFILFYFCPQNIYFKIVPPQLITKIACSSHFTRRNVIKFLTFSGYVNGNPCVLFREGEINISDTNSPTPSLLIPAHFLHDRPYCLILAP